MTTHTIKSFILKYNKLISRTDLDYLISYFLKLDRGFVISHPEYIIEKAWELDELIQRRLNWYSVASICWKKEFYWREFIVSESTLIPRPESEIIVDEVLKLEWIEKVLDLGTGTWCLIISIGKERPTDKLVGVDISLKALEIAHINAINHWVNVEFVHSDLLSNVKDDYFDAIIANLPYVPNKDRNSEIEKEPDIALYSWEDWLDIIRRLRNELKHIEFKYLFLEFAPFQVNAIQEIFGDIYLVKIINDLSLVPRIAKITMTWIKP